MDKTKIVLIAAAAAIIFITAAAIYMMTDRKTSETDALLSYDPVHNFGETAETVQNKISEEEIFNQTQSAITSVRVYEETESEGIPEEYLKDPYLLLEETYDDTEGLLGSVRNRDPDVLKTYFDNLEFTPGMRLCDIIDHSHWYADSADNMIEPNESVFVCLENSFWTNDEIKLVNKAARNGDIFLWVHNYSSEQAAIRDCVVYKYQISYLGCKEQFSERPELKYLDRYYLGYDDEFDKADSEEKLVLDRGECTRYTYGDASKCQVLLDRDKSGLAAVTVSYNIYYGPKFDDYIDREGE